MPLPIYSSLCTGLFCSYIYMSKYIYIYLLFFCVRFFDSLNPTLKKSSKNFKGQTIVCLNVFCNIISNWSYFSGLNTSSNENSVLLKILPLCAITLWFLITMSRPSPIQRNGSVNI